MRAKDWRHHNRGSGSFELARHGYVPKVFLTIILQSINVSKGQFQELLCLYSIRNGGRLPIEPQAAEILRSVHVVGGGFIRAGELECRDDVEIDRSEAQSELDAAFGLRLSRKSIREELEGFVSGSKPILSSPTLVTRKPTTSRFLSLTANFLGRKLHRQPQLLASSAINTSQKGTYKVED